MATQREMDLAMLEAQRRFEEALAKFYVNYYGIEEPELDELEEEPAEYLEGEQELDDIEEAETWLEEPITSDMETPGSPLASNMEFPLPY